MFKKFGIFIIFDYNVWKVVIVNGEGDLVIEF